MAKALLICLTTGLIWQFVLVVVLVGREQGTLRWSTLREALWLRSPQSPSSGRRGGRLWLILAAAIRPPVHSGSSDERRTAGPGAGSRAA